MKRLLFFPILITLLLSSCSQNKNSSKYEANKEANEEYAKWMDRCIEQNINWGNRDYSKGVKFGKYGEITVNNKNKESFFRSFCEENDSGFWEYWEEEQNKIKGF